MDRYDEQGSVEHPKSGNAKSNVIRIDILPVDAAKRERPQAAEQEIRLYEFLDEYEAVVRSTELSNGGALNSCRAVVPLLKALEAANELVSGMRMSKRPKESWKLSLLRAEVYKCIMNIRALGKRLEQYHSSLDTRPSRPDA